MPDQDPESCPECGSGDLTAYSYDDGQTTTGYECRDCEHNWRTGH
jgi:hypothetical protein